MGLGSGEPARIGGANRSFFPKWIGCARARGKRREQCVASK